MQVIQVELFGEMVEIERTADGKFKRPEWLKDLHQRGNALAPKHEPILLFRKPREGRTFAQCAREFGSGGLDIGATRVRSNTPVPKPGGRIRNKRNAVSSSLDNDYQLVEPPSSNPAGRWPPNIAFSHVAGSVCPTCHGSGCEACDGRGTVGGCLRVGTRRVKGSQLNHECHNSGKIYQFDENIQMHKTGYTDADGCEQVDDWECHESCPVRALDEQAGERPGSHDQIVNSKEYKMMFGNVYRGKGYNDTGSASRFYPCHDWSYEIAERLAGETPFRYVAKCSTGERNAGLSDMMKLKDGLTEDEKNYVMSELAKVGFA